ncbi:hypothetical protein IEO21_09437 [Rhodonia placenta]|uniref:CPL domain-containing protein n=1 Tax=Rhodonia placenta TaxID=104341 RepID=A0A8H7NUE7_9APHY|nr:hypothetical protein IEO21_09437 [Postia placenta]
MAPGKKRQAGSQAGPKTKKLQLEKTPADKGKKRSQPITRPLQEETLDSSEESDGDEPDEEEVIVEGEAQPAVAKDPNAARESHKAQKVLHEQRKASKPHFDTLAQAKSAWRLAHQKSLPKVERTKYINQLMDVIRGHVIDIVFKHDASRIVQTVVRYGGEKERNEIASELKGRFKELAQNKYSKEFQGSVLRLLLHREASSVLADAFELYTNAYERSMLLRDFYGKEASLFTVTAGSEEEKERSKKGLKGILEGVEGERRKRIMAALKDNLMSIFNNPDKGAVSHAIVHRALWEYLSTVNTIEDEAEQEKLRREIFESCQDVLAEMVHTKDGSRSVRELIVRGTAKDRKHIVKAIKSHVERMCKDDEAQLVLFTALDVIEYALRHPVSAHFAHAFHSDTKLTAKSLVSDVISSATSLYQSSQGRRSLIYLVAPRTRRHFTPAQINLLAEIDSVRAQTSKKDSDVRCAEIRRAASDGLLSWIAENGAAISRDTGGCLVVCEVMLYAEGDKSAASETLLKALSATCPAPDPAHPHPISLPHTSRMYKTLLQGGHFSHTTRTIEPAALWSARDFATKFVEIVGRDVIVAMARDEGAFVIAALCEQLAASDAEEKKTLHSWFTKGVKKEIEDAAGKGSSVLLQSLKALD